MTEDPRVTSAGSERTEGAQSLEQTVVVLYGALRSGTTMIRLMLDAHPRISCPGEMDFMVDFLHEDAGHLRLDRDSLATNRIFRASGLQVPATEDAADAFRDMAQQAGAGRPGHVLVLVMHRHLGRLLRVFPAARIIHLIRDPRDVARSSVGMGWAGNTWYGVDHWIGTEREWDRHGAALPDRQVLSLQYEALLQNPEEQLSRLCEFMGLDYDPRMLTFDQTSTYSAVDPQLAFQWRHKQTPREIAEVEHKVGVLLTSRGYEPSGHPPAAPSILRRVHLTLGNKRHNWKVRFERYGYIDPLLETFSRRLGLRSLNRTVRMRIERKLQKYLK